MRSSLCLSLVCKFCFAVTVELLGNSTKSESTEVSTMKTAERGKQTGKSEPVVKVNKIIKEVLLPFCPYSLIMIFFFSLSV